MGAIMSAVDIQAENKLIGVVKRFGLVVIGVVSAYLMIQLMQAIFGQLFVKAQAQSAVASADIRTLNKSRMVVARAKTNPRSKELAEFIPDRQNIMYIEGIKIEDVKVNPSNENASGTVGLALEGKAVLEDNSEVIITPCLVYMKYLGGGGGSMMKLQSAESKSELMTMTIKVVRPLAQGGGGGGAPIECPYGVVQVSDRDVEEGTAVVRWVLDAVPDNTKIKSIKIIGFAFTDNEDLENSRVKATLRLTGLQS